ncbi:M23 family metallopeptidase [Sphingorhabdus sp. 109]|jgi:murein DD-endopeptidase MepM/ murein hydrolase activator NlpD|uniref:M23 family metallopeptidase n=1 Tax=Sphingorhabdus sp. 109 TaxID=2653173 RepID=UPI0012F01BC5|nr:M23 family metallopeptidase [Sphingorhabdus sp. 109]VWX60878.1 Peptidase M23 [Sphingorhabdus sp. 109]
MHKQNTGKGLKARLDHMFTDREFFMRSHGQVRFLTISARLQKRLFYTVAAALIFWLLVTLAMMVNQLTVTSERMALAQKEAEVNSTESRVANYKASIEDVAADLKQRQDVLDQMTEQFVGEQTEAAETAAQKQADEQLFENTRKISAAFPEAARLAELEARQIKFARRLTMAAIQRTKQAEEAIRKFGLNPEKLTKNSMAAMGGPLIPFFSNKDQQLHPTLERLNLALQRMDALERTLIAIPSGKPSSTGMISSSYGYRRDPFTGGGAMHSGIDFKGPRGLPILAAAGGKVTHAGWKSGYGKTVEITHGNGLMTRYAHLSKIGVTTGQKIEQGIQLGAMGSTGRSTGTHLHFEVRLNGRAINPRPFLEANSDVLKIKAIARQRASSPKRTESGADRG